MLIKDLFARDIFRPINGVVKADQLDDSSVWQELDEFVITRELDQHFRKFFSSYTDAIKSPKDPDVAGKIGRLDLGLLRLGQVALPQGAVLPAAKPTHTHERQEQAGRRVLRGQDQGRHALRGHQAGRRRRSTDVILFNIDSKADHRTGRDAILRVFLKVLNEMQGYSGDHPHIAHMERYLEGKGKLEQFHDAYRKITGTEWLQERDAYQFNRDEVVEGPFRDARAEPGLRGEVDRRCRGQLLADRRELLQMGQGVPGLEGAAAPPPLPGR